MRQQSPPRGGPVDRGSLCQRVKASTISLRASAYRKAPVGASGVAGMRREWLYAASERLPCELFRRCRTHLGTMLYEPVTSVSSGAAAIKTGLRVLSRPGRGGTVGLEHDSSQGAAAGANTHTRARGRGRALWGVWGDPPPASPLSAVCRLYTGCTSGPVASRSSRRGPRRVGAQSQSCVPRLRAVV